jgi:hypothetical protein
MAMEVWRIIMQVKDIRWVEHVARVRGKLNAVFGWESQKDRDQ